MLRLLFVSLVIVSLHGLNIAQPLDAKSIYLSKYTFHPSRENSLIGNVSLSRKSEYKMTLTGKNANLFQLKNDTLLLNERGKRFFLKFPRASFTLSITKDTEPVVQKTFTIVRDDFIRNPVIAHRGAWKNTNTPQNSIASLQAAVNLGAAGSEFDIHMTADEVPVINHDPVYNGMTIEKTNYADLLKSLLPNGEPIPTLENYLKTGMLQQKTKLVAEIKSSIISKERSLKLTGKVMEMVDRLQAQAWMVYICFDYDILKRILKSDPFAHTQYLKGEISPEQLKADGVQGADYHYGVYQQDEKWIEKAHELNTIVNAWTVNDPLLMDCLIAHNIDLITTDEPEILLDLLSKRSDKKTLLWGDEFNYTGLPDSTKWGYDVGGHGWGNNEQQFYTRADTANAYVSDGTLHITARKQAKENKDYTSARLVTKGKADFKYGKIEMRVRLPKGRGTWPAIWMLGKNISVVDWPMCGEIDIAEHVGFAPDSVFGTVHTQAYNHTLNTQKGKRAFIENPYGEFHVYAIDWSPEKISFWLDGKAYYQFLNEHKTKNEWPFDDPFYLIINIAVGGTLGGKHGVDETVFPAVMDVDYVRVFKN